MVWKAIDAQELGLMKVFSESVERSQRRDPELLPDMRRSKTLLVTSDYSGHHRACRFESYGILLIGMEDCWPSWEAARLELRRRHRIGRRSFAFKKLNDACKRRALVPFLEASEILNGLCVTVLIDKSIPSMFRKDGPLELSSPSLQPYAAFGAIFERLLRVVHLVSFFLAGLSGEGQNVFWFTDQDAIAANPNRLTLLTQVWATVLSNYLSHQLGHLRCGTTESDNGTLQIEDLAAVPDLVAGALAEAITCYEKDSYLPDGKLIVPLPSSVSPKARAIIGWLSRRSRHLKRLSYVIHPVQGSTGLTVKHLQFHS